MLRLFFCQRSRFLTALQRDTSFCCCALALGSRATAPQKLTPFASAHDFLTAPQTRLLLCTLGVISLHIRERNLGALTKRLCLETLLLANCEIAVSAIFHLVSNCFGQLFHLFRLADYLE